MQGKENTLNTKLKIALATLRSAAALASNMKSRTSAWTLAMTLFATLATPLPLAAQDSQDRKHEHHHYKLLDLGTFGGPQSFVNFPKVGYTPVLNNSGTVAGWADTAVPDPHPNFCFTFVDCHVEHAFLSKGIGKTNLGSLPAPIPTSSQPNWIAQSGYAAGVSENGELDPLVLDSSGSPFVSEFRAVFWGEDGIVDLGAPPQGGYESVAYAVNDHGQVVGFFTNTIPDANSIFGLGYQTRAFIWKGGVMQDLGALGGTDAQAMLINDRGQVVGESYLNSNPSPACGLPLATGAFLWENGKMQNLGSLGGTCTLPSDLNERGQIVGLSNLPDDQNAHAFLWENGTMKDLGNTFGGANSSAISINHAGHVVGWGEPAGNNLPQPQHASLWKNGVQTDLGAFGTDCAFAVTINSKDQIAGASYPRAGATYPNCNYDLPARGFLYENGELVDLNNLVPPDSKLHVSEPETINDRGEIAGLGVDASGNSRAFLLIPCDEHHPEVEGCNYDMVDSGTAAQVRPAQINGFAVAASGAKLAQADKMTRYRSALTRRNQRVRSLAVE
jgi:probable HAF family extracellular repeat protein